MTFYLVSFGYVHFSCLLFFICVCATCVCSLGQIPLDSSIREFSYRLPSTFKVFAYAIMMTDLINVFVFGCCYSLIGELISLFSTIPTGEFTLSCKCIGILFARCFEKYVGLKWMMS